MTLFDEARERRIALSLRVSEVLNSLVRPILALMFGGTISYMALVGIITSGEYLGMAALILGYFFQSRETEKAQTRLQEQQGQLVELAKAVPVDAPIASRHPDV